MQYLITRYPSNRRMYDARKKKHINQWEVEALIRAGHEVRIMDSVTKADVTQAILLRILSDRVWAGDRLPEEALIVSWIRRDRDLTHLKGTCA